MKYYRSNKTSGEYRFLRAARSGLGSMLVVGPSFKRPEKASTEQNLRDDAVSVGRDMKIAIRKQKQRLDLRNAG